MARWSTESKISRVFRASHWWVWNLFQTWQTEVCRDARAAQRCLTGSRPQCLSGCPHLDECQWRLLFCQDKFTFKVGLSEDKIQCCQTNIKHWWLWHVKLDKSENILTNFYEIVTIVLPGIETLTVKLRDKLILMLPWLSQMR